jgi:hypothetical protein
MRVSQEKQQSEIRIADLRVELIRAVRVVHDKHPDALTHEEVLAALLDVSSQQVRHLLPSTEG